MIDWAHAYPAAEEGAGRSVVVDLMADDVTTFRSKMTIAAAKRLRDDITTALAIIGEEKS